MQERLLNTTGLNPVLPLNIYTADGEPKVFGDRVYVYGSKDLFNGGYCCYEYNVYSAPIDDLTKWTDHGVSFISRDKDGNFVDVPWSNELLWAPDVVKKDDTYYLYFCLSDGTEGVAESKTPYGPFTNARQIVMNGEPIKGIDPSVLEDNGKFYYTWGQGQMRMGELEDDMCTIKPETYHAAIITNGPGREGFHEGSSLRKVGDKYCIVYASEWKENYPNFSASPTKLDYAVSDNPYGPYERKGTIINNVGIDPQSWNNHGSILKIKDSWYVFYHASSNNTKYSRRMRVEKIYVDEATCTIAEARISSNGFLECVPSEMLKEPANACEFMRGAYVTEKEDGVHPLVNLFSGSGAVFRNVCFDGGKYQFEVNYCPFENSALRLYVGKQLACEVELPKTNTSATVEMSISKCNEPVYMEMRGVRGKELCNIINFEFRKT